MIRQIPSALTHFKITQCILDCLKYIYTIEEYVFVQVIKYTQVIQSNIPLYLLERQWYLKVSFLLMRKMAFEYEFKPL